MSSKLFVIGLGRDNASMCTPSMELQSLMDQALEYLPIDRVAVHVTNPATGVVELHPIGRLGVTFVADEDMPEEVPQKQVAAPKRGQELSELFPTEPPQIEQGRPWWKFWGSR